MHNYITFALKKIKNSGFKITKQRRMVVELLAKSDKALSPYDMRNILKQQKIKADVVTIYRILETLEKLSLAHKVLAFNGYIHCNTEEFGDNKTSCHHYLICKKCRKIDEIEGENISKLEQKIELEKKFHIDSHYLEFLGLCSECSHQTNK